MHRVCYLQVELARTQPTSPSTVLLVDLHVLAVSCLHASDFVQIGRSNQHACILKLDKKPVLAMRCALRQHCTACSRRKHDRDDDNLSRRCASRIDKSLQTLTSRGAAIHVLLWRKSRADAASIIKGSTHQVQSQTKLCRHIAEQRILKINSKAVRAADLITMTRRASLLLALAAAFSTIVSAQDPTVSLSGVQDLSKIA